MFKLDEIFDLELRLFDTLYIIIEIQNIFAKIKLSDEKSGIKATNI